MYSPSGTIGTNLLKSFTNHLGMELVESFGQQMTEHYTSLRFGFDIRDGSIGIRGMQSGAIVNDENGNLMLVADHGNRFPISGIVRLVATPADLFNGNAAVLAKHLVASDAFDSGTGSGGLPIERTAETNQI